MIIALVLLSVAISSVAQLLLKLGMTSGSVKSSMEEGGILPIALSIGMNPMVVCGLFLYFLGAVAWLFVLSKLPLNVAYPFVALGFVFTAILSYLILQEKLAVTTYIGGLFIIVGVILVSRGMGTPT